VGSIGNIAFLALRHVKNTGPNQLRSANDATRFADSSEADVATSSVATITIRKGRPVQRISVKALLAPIRDIESKGDVLGSIDNTAADTCVIEADIIPSHVAFGTISKGRPGKRISCIALSAPSRVQTPKSHVLGFFNYASRYALPTIADISRRNTARRTVFKLRPSSRISRIAYLALGSVFYPEPNEVSAANHATSGTSAVETDIATDDTTRVVGFVRPTRTISSRAHDAFVR